MSQNLFLTYLEHELKSRGVQLAKKLTGLHHVEELVVRFGKEQIATIITNMNTDSEFHTLHGRLTLTLDQKKQWERERAEVRRHLGL